MMHLGSENRIDQMGKRNLPFHDPNKRQGCEQRHHPLGIVEDARCLENQNKAKGDQGIKHPSHQAVQHHFHAIKKLIRHLLSPSQ